MFSTGALKGISQPVLRTKGAGAGSAPAGSPFLLSELGLSTDRAGILSISDQDKFDEALAETPQALENIFTGEDGIAGQILNLLDRFISSGGVVDDSRKNVDNRIKNINSRIDRFEDRLRVRETQLRRQFTDLQRQLSRLQSQQSIISQTLGLFGRRGGAIGSFF